MSRIIEMTSGFGPEMIAGAGYVAGVAVDYLRDQKFIEKNRLAAAESTSAVYADQQPGRSQRLASAALSPLAMMALAGYGFMNIDAWSGPDGPSVQPPHLEIVVDHSGATGLGDRKPLNQINTLASKFVQGAPDSQAVVARAGEVRILTPAEVAKDIPFGDAPLEQAYQTATDNNNRLRVAAFDDFKKKSIGTLVLTYGNSIGNPATIIETAKAQGSPVYVVNVTSAAKGQANTKPLQEIAEKTDGKYWDGTTADPNDVLKTVTDGLVSRSAPEVKKNTDVPGRVKSVLPFILAVPIIRAWRRRGTNGTFSGVKAKNSDVNIKKEGK